ncbi:MAG: sigma-70 family RNA polymerase sigma factor [Pseudomonadota bacterium]|nr:sigma-70 family RNA polymerase sigma factor [Sphingomonas sp.]MDQ3478569.1 sigma-70 family RNA polymerase sigma factor [Pseudomonadota bacterium]
MSAAPAPNALELVPIMQAVAAGDRKALADLYGRTSAKLYGICIRLLGSEPEAEDVLQDVYLTVWNKAGSFDGNKASPITWLAVLARNKAIDRLRRQTAPTTTFDDAPDLADDAPSALEVLQQDEDQKRLNGCLDELDDQQRDSIRSAFLDGATYPQLAERERVPLGTMKSWIRRGLLRLRGCLER